MQIFGFEIRKSNERSVSIVGPASDDGALEQASSLASSHYSYNLDVNQKPKNDLDLINKYRQLQMVPAVDAAIEDIVSEAVVIEDSKSAVSLNIIAEIDAIPLDIQDKIADEFQNVITLLNFSRKGHELFRQWYVDGRQAFHIIIDEADPRQGIKEVRFVDPRKIRKVREIFKERTTTQTEIVTAVEEYFVFNDAGMTNTTNTGLKLSSDSIAYVTSGLLDETNTTISYLHKAMKPANQLRYMEDAMLIYQLSRAPQRRIFYIDVADMPKQKAEQYVKDTMNRYRNKMVYDSASGEIKDDRNNMSILEDFWCPRKGNGNATEITTLEGGQIVGQLESTAYFQNNLYRSLNVPISRILPDQSFSVGRSTEITRDEVKFSKFIDRLRIKYSALFDQLLRVQLITKEIISPDDWAFVSSKIQYVFARDNYFAELKDNEILAGRIQMMEQASPYAGKYFSQEYLRKNIMRQTTEEIAAMDKQLAIEAQQEQQKINAMSPAQKKELESQEPTKENPNE